MRFQSEIINNSIEELIGQESVQRLFLLTNYGIEKNKAADNPERLAELDRKLKLKDDRITENKNYLKSLRTRFKESQTEESLQSLLNEIESIDVKVGFFNQRLGSNRDSPPKIVIRPKEGEYDKSIDSLKSIRNELMTSLQCIQSVKNKNHTTTIGMPDADQKITSPALEMFTRKSTATNHEVFPDNLPTALVDFRRNITVNGVKFTRTISADELKTSLMEFLNTSESIRQSAPNVREALCNAMLKNGQALQTAFTNEYDAKKKPYLTPLTLGNELCMIAQTEANFNWTINERGQLTVNIELDMKSVLPMSNSKAFPLVIDKKTGEIREFDFESEKIGQCPTILKYQSSISFETKTETHEEAGKEPVTETVAIPHVNDYTVTLFHDQFQYKPTLTAFEQLETAPKQAAAPPAAQNK